MEMATDGRPIRVGTGQLGRGVFATRPIASGETFEICPTMDLMDADVTGRLGDYVLKSSEDEDVVVLMFGWGMLYNHSQDPNAEYRQHDVDEIAFIALREIDPDEEITISYGEDWWETRELSPE
jgi:SET domain-containing protein